MSDLGQLLKKARSEKGINLEELQETTKIQKRYLEAIEEGNFSILPGSFYVRAFIKSYSEAVGLDPDEVLRLYRNVIPAPSAEYNVEPIRKKRQKSFNTDRLSKWTSTLLMWLFPLLIIIFIYVYITQIHDNNPSIPDEQTQITDDLNEPTTEFEDNLGSIDDLDDSNDSNGSNGSEEDEETDVVEDPPPKPQVTYVNTDASTYIYNVSDVELLKVELKVVGTSCWVLVREVNNEGEALVETEYPKDHEEIWEVDHSLWIRMGNPSNVEIRINDQLIDREKLLESNPWNLQINLVSTNSNQNNL